MPAEQAAENLNQLLDNLSCAGGKDERVTLGDMLQATGRRAFGPLLLVPGLIALSPLSGIPGIPTSTALIVMLVAVPLLIGRQDFWLPKVLLSRSVGRSKLDKAIKFLRPVARVIDKFLRRRLSFFTEGLGVRLVALVCFFIAATMPPLELLPFAATTAGAALTLFGVSLVAHDGLIACVAFALCVATPLLISQALL